MDFNRKLLGNIGEEIAKKYLISNGYNILESNYRTKYGEIDCIAFKDKTYYFIEVKTRNNIIKGYPYEAVNTKKINRIIKSSKVYCLQNNLREIKLTIAIISIIFNNKQPIINFYTIYD